MYVAWRELRFARGRFILIGSVVALITLLVGFLAGLTGGLADRNVSAVLALPGDRLVLGNSSDGSAGFADSTISAESVDAWTRAEGVDAVMPIGISQGRVTRGAEAVAVAFFGMPRQSTGVEIAGLTPESNDTVGLSEGAADQLQVAVGDEITVAGHSYAVESVGADLWFSHLPVVVMSPDAWSAVDRSLGGTGEATVLAVTGDADWEAVEEATGTTSRTPLASLTSLETFTSEIGSLGLMIGMLFVVSALVVGAFFTVWTMQRAGDVAVLKALGASTASLVRDALAQALVVLVAGMLVGLSAVVAFGLLAARTLPFLLSPWTTVLPATVMLVLGLAGSAVALRTVTHADPLTALGSNR